MFEFDEAAMANAVEGQVCAGCSRKLWCTVSASASYGGTQNETYHYGSVQFPRAASAPAYSFYAAHQGRWGNFSEIAALSDCGQEHGVAARLQWHADLSVRNRSDVSRVRSRQC